MNTEPPPPLPPPPRKRIALALVLAFLPSVFVLILVPLHTVSGAFIAVYCTVAAILSPGCCIAASIMLFKRNTSATIVFGVVFGLLNLVISAGLGCAALLSDFNVH